jgi:hypothetical protein
VVRRAASPLPAPPERNRHVVPPLDGPARRLTLHREVALGSQGHLALYAPMEAVCDAARAIAAGEAPAFRTGGTVTGGNSSPLNDGAAALLLMSEDAVHRSGVTPLARYAGTAAAGVHPDYMGIGPVPAMHKALGRAGWRLDEVDLIEINEAFAAQAVAVMDELKCDPGLVNVNGGAIAIGHPLGCSGARIVATLLHEMRRRGAVRGAATMCIGVGQGITSLWEAPRRNRRAPLSCVLPFR